MFRRHHHHHHPTTVVVTGRRPAPIAGAMIGTAAMVGTAAVVGSAMSRSRTNNCHTHVVAAPSQTATASAPAPASPVYLYLKCTSGHYLTENNKSVSSPLQVTPNGTSVWYEQHVGNGYYVYKSQNGRLLSVCDHGDVKLAKLKNPVKQKCMFYREQIGQHCRFRSVSGFFLCVDKSGHVTTTKTPQKNALFALELVPPHSQPSSHTPPPPQSAHVSRDAPSPVSSHVSSPTSSFEGNGNMNSSAPMTNAPSPSYQPYASQPYTGAPQPGPTPGYQPYAPTAQGYSQPQQYAPPPGQGGYSPMPNTQYSAPYGAPTNSAMGPSGGYNASRDMNATPPQPQSGAMPSYLQGLNSSTSNPNSYY